MIDERLKTIADHYGLENQLGILQEECAELIQAVSKYRRGEWNPIHISEEMADTIIMIEQMAYLLKIEKDMNYTIKWKITRQMKRIEEETAQEEDQITFDEILEENK